MPQLWNFDQFLIHFQNLLEMSLLETWKGCPPDTVESLPGLFLVAECFFLLCNEALTIVRLYMVNSYWFRRVSACRGPISTLNEVGFGEVSCRTQLLQEFFPPKGEKSCSPTEKVFVWETSSKKSPLQFAASGKKLWELNCSLKQSVCPRLVPPPVLRLRWPRAILSRGVCGDKCHTHQHFVSEPLLSPRPCGLANP